MELWVGTSGYSYKEWKGGFYPAGLADDEMLRSYSEQLPAVEINNTFYRLPRTSILESWAAQVPDRFRFVLKASRRITHNKRLRDAGDETAYLYDTAGVLGRHLGVILFQLPPNLPKDLPRLQAFLQLVPSERAAFEFRHASWFDDEVCASLHSRGSALVLADTDENPLSAMVKTASWGYLRLRKDQYLERDLEDLARRVRSQDWERAYVFFKDEGEGRGPRYALKFLEVAQAG